MNKTNIEISELGRVGVIDVGSNSVRMVVFDGAARSPAYFYNEKVLCGLGKGLLRSHKLNPEGKERALSALRRFKVLADQMELNSLGAVGTAAVREAEDGPAFCRQVQDDIGIDLVSISGEEEARLSANGVLLGWPDANGLVCDLGGSSLEFAEIKNGKIGNIVTTALGPLSIVDVSDDIKAQDAVIKNELAEIAPLFQRRQENIYLVGGSLRAIAKFHMERNNYPLRVLHNYHLPVDEVLDTIAIIGDCDQDELTRMVNASPARIELLPTAIRVLKQILTQFKTEEVTFSSYGLREGLLFERMPKGLQTRDPLLEACRSVEEAQARFPGFGDQLCDWLLPLFPEADNDRKRLIRAACILHDVYWASHPDYRSEICFYGATHANFGGIGHQGRVFIAWALLNRYKTKAMSLGYHRLRDLLSAEERQLAESVGRAMRLGAMMTGAEISDLGKIRKTKVAVELSLDSNGADVFGEVVKKRFDALADSLGRKGVVTYA
ncbi:exopolyphosphatase [Amylibacter ulvae]|uniref:Exopolyphosphatase n=1 Tax=Paramylibacter ulvae TaxID=1651968 RepID=A0ABQ3CZK4_9RHOB|nr:exopolyphosphatase [Amylibacter ulvae]GHA46080.1 exopolyphosphatase [Amylibacter ulvae]